MGRNILFITTDQQRWDALGCYGNRIAQTPIADGLANDGIRYERAYCQGSVCMPSRATMITGQHVSTHGVHANGVALPLDAPSVAAHLRDAAGYRTALLGKAHFEPGFDPSDVYPENRLAPAGSTGPLRGFEHLELAMHVAQAGRRPLQHYGHWLAQHHPEHTRSFASLLSAQGGGDTGAPETKHNPIPRELYHTDWVANVTLAWLDSLADDEDWFAWMSFPDPHHPWDPPASELHRVPWRELDLPASHPGSDEAIRRVLASKPAHWLACYEGRYRNIEGGPGAYRPGKLSHDQIREVNAMAHIMNELIDEACGRVLEGISARGWLNDTDVFLTTDHGEMQGDCGFLFKGPYPVDSLLRVPLIWRPAPSAGIDSAVVPEPVGHVDLAATFCEVAGIEPADWMEGSPLPIRPGSGRERVLSEWNSQFSGYGMHQRTIYRDGWLCTAYGRSTRGEATGVEPFLDSIGMPEPRCEIDYDGSEGELYRVEDDPHQHANRWDDASLRRLRDELVRDLADHMPPARIPKLPVSRPT